MWTEYSHAISFADPGAAKLAKGRQLRLYVKRPYKFVIADPEWYIACGLEDF